MKLIGAGLPRTATMTQKAALEQLGLAPCHHMVNVFADLPTWTQWRDAINGDRRASELVGEHPAVVDWPSSYFYKELMEDFPDAKVLLSVRDPEGWARSMRVTIIECLYGDGFVGHMSAARERIDEDWHGWMSTLREMWTQTGLLNGADTTDEWMIDAFNRYNASVQEYVPAERLLVWNPKDGWEPLCAFLELPVPDGPVPHVNDSAGFGDLIAGGALRVIQAHMEQRAGAPA